MRTAGRSIALWPAIALALLAVGLPVASAARLPLTGSSLFVQQLVGAPSVPGYLVRDEFEGGGGLAGRPADTGGVWAVADGSFVLDSGGASREGNNRDEALAWIDPQVTRLRVSATLELNGQFELALVAMFDPASGRHVRASWSGNQSGTLQIVLVDGSNETVLASAGSLGVQAQQLELVVDPPMVTASAGSSAITDNLNPSELGLLGGTATGIWSGEFGRNDAFTSFSVESLP